MLTLVWDNVAGTFPTVNEIEVDKETGLNKNSQYSLPAPTGQRCRSAFVVGLISQVWPRRRCQCRLFMITLESIPKYFASFIESMYLDVQLNV